MDGLELVIQLPPQVLGFIGSELQGGQEDEMVENLWGNGICHKPGSRKDRYYRESVGP
jgi:hypothetical protein